MLESILTTDGLTVMQFLVLSGASLGLGFLSALVYMYKNLFQRLCAHAGAAAGGRTDGDFAGFRQSRRGHRRGGHVFAGAVPLGPGRRREIAAIFLAMAIGLATGMGYLGVACLMFALLAAASLVLVKVRFGEQEENHRLLRITMPEDLDYTNVFDGVFSAYTRRAELKKVKTTNLGSMFELQYDVTLRDAAMEKRFLDELRTRNGNLNIQLTRTPGGKDEL
jgi:hypothetical protein